MTRYSTLKSAKMCDLAAAVMSQGCGAHEFKVMTWDPDAGKEVEITGFLVDPERKVISLQTDVD